MPWEDLINTCLNFTKKNYSTINFEEDNRRKMKKKCNKKSQINRENVLIKNHFLTII